MNPRAFRACRRGISMMEVALGTLLVGGVLGATINLIGPTVRSTVLAGDKQLAVTLADELLDEIATRSFGDPDGDSGSLGVDAGESATVRTDFDDVDDYRGYSSNPSDRDGMKLSGFGDGWAYAVDVKHVEVQRPDNASLTLTGAKRITVRVSRGGVVLAERSIVRTSAFDDARKH